MEDIAITRISCPTEKCHCIFYLPSVVVDRLIQTHESFFCPYGHTQSYQGKNDLEKTKDELEKYRKLYIETDQRVTRLANENYTLKKHHKQKGKNVKRT